LPLTFQLGFNRRHAGLDLVEHEGDLFVVRPVAAQAIRARALKRAPEHLDDCRELPIRASAALLTAVWEAMRLFSASIATRPSAKDQRMSSSKAHGELCNGRLHHLHLS
jgi:hypothetical protein